MSVANVLNGAIYNKLTGNSGLTDLLNSATAIYYLQAPDGATLPYVVFSVIEDAADNQQGSDMRTELIMVRGYANTPALAGSIDIHAGTALHRQQLTVSGYNNFWTVRETGNYTVENEPSGQRIYGAGADYRIRLDPS